MNRQAGPLGLAGYVASLARAREAFYPSPFLVSIVGGGGKTTSLIELFQAGIRPRSILTTTTAMGLPGTGGDLGPPLTEEQKNNPALTKVFLTPPPSSGLWFGSLIEGTRDKYKGLAPRVLDSWIREEREAGRQDAILFCEADGSRRKPLKAHADHEPVIPKTTDLTLVIFGLSGLGRPFHEDLVHRSSIFSDLTGRKEGQPVQMEDLLVLLESGHLFKGVPLTSKLLVLFNQADLLPPAMQSTEVMEALASRVLQLDQVDGVFFLGMKGGVHQSLHSQVRDPVRPPRLSAVILAAGMSTRMGGANKLLLPLDQDLVIQRTLARVLASDVGEVILVTGHQAPEIEAAIRPLLDAYEGDKSIRLVHNPRYREGQGGSVAAGAGALDPKSRAALFIQGDQPFLDPLILRQLLEEASPPKIVVPVSGGRRTSPVVFGSCFYPELSALRGETGGRQIMAREEEAVIDLVFDGDFPSGLDLDTAEDYKEALKKLT